MLSCEADRTIPSLFWQQVKRLRGNEEEEDTDIKDEEDQNRPQRKGRSTKKTLDWDDALISPVTAEEVKASKLNTQLLQHETPNIIQQITLKYNRVE